MDRQELRSTLSNAAGPRAVIAMVERHACRLEQVPQQAARTDPEALARALRSAQGLYGLAAVTVGDGGELLTRAARASHAAADRGGVLASAEVAVAREVFRRLRAVLRGRAGIVVVLPAASRLGAQVGLDSGTSAGLLAEAMRGFGEDEPDAFVLTGHDGDPDPVHDTLAAHYGAALIRVGEWTTPGVAVRPDLAPGDAYGEEFLVITPGEVEPRLEPADVRSRLAAALTRDRVQA